MKSRCMVWVGVVAAALFVFFFASMPTLAAEAAQEDPAASPAGVAFRWLNFIFVFGGAAYLIAKNGGSFFRGNAKAIAASITEAQAVKAEADRELREVETKIARLDQEVVELREASRRDSLAEAERLRASGQAEIEKIKQTARAEMAAADRVAQQELRSLAASLAVEHAAALVNQKMNPTIRERIFRAFLGALGQGQVAGTGRSPN
jgi:F0F1-type ATP synthase membrane subunit b/b'